MTINEYLSLASKLRRHIARCEEKYNAAFLVATSASSALGDDGAISNKSSGHNEMERKLIRNADAARELIKARQTYDAYKEQLEKDMYNLYFWEGLLIEQVYIYNPALEEESFYRVDEILHTSDRRKMQLKLNEAKSHLAEIMRARGAEIDNNNRTE